MIVSSTIAATPRMTANRPKTMPRAIVVTGPVTLLLAVPTALTIVSVACAGQSSVRTRVGASSSLSATGGSVVSDRCASTEPVPHAREGRRGPHRRGGGQRARCPDPRRVRVQRCDANRSGGAVRPRRVGDRDRDRTRARTMDRRAQRGDGGARTGARLLRVVGRRASAVPDGSVGGDDLRGRHGRTSSGYPVSPQGRAHRG